MANAKETYKTRQKEVKSLIGQLQTTLKRHNLKFKKNETNWGYPGDLGHVKAELKELVGFLK